MNVAAEFLARQSDLPMTPVASRLDRSSATGHTLVLAEPGPTPVQAGLAVLGSFFGGHRHVFRTVVTLDRAESLRIEVHGHVSRMNKIVVHLSRDGAVLLQGEEVESVAVLSDGTALTVEMTFLAHGSMVEWIYLLGQDIDERQGAILSCSDTSLQPLPAQHASLSRRHFPAQTIRGVSAACQTFTALHGGFNVIFEILKPGSALVGLGLSSDLGLAHARWWTWQTEGIDPRPGELVPCRPVHPIRSPGLMDAYGASFANLGHAISGIFADWHELDRMDAATADLRAQMTLHARFQSGDVVDLPLAEIVGGSGDAGGGDTSFDRFRTAYLARTADRPTLLEVGARGEASAAIRRTVEPDWRYVGLDYLGDANVDIVGDAHRLTDFVARESVDMVYSSEVMEHLLSPLRFVLEANRVLKLHGLFIARMPTTWPLHAEPWDYWRVSVHGWTSILNANTGFEILERCEIGHASIVPHAFQKNSGLMSMAGAPAPMLTMVIARKIRDVPFDTSGWSPELASGSYDHA